ncbi:hypothetical protein [Actinomadura hibisca]|uniref:hypothetical protein n=1 Tax=Actinomadura hibisca TaxID=68565 RepID=UPI00082B8776|nr:hypothetical protein [Actinomadura hibisca]
MSAVILLGDFPATGVMKQIVARRVDPPADAQAAPMFIDAVAAALRERGAVLVLYPSWRAKQAERLVTLARGALLSDRIAGVPLRLPPMALSLVADQLAFVAMYVRPGMLASLPQRLAENTVAGAWVRSVAHFEHVHIKLGQHVSSYLPGGGFSVVMSPDTDVRRITSSDPVQAFPQLPPGPMMVLTAQQDGDVDWFHRSLSPALNASSMLAVEAQPLSAGYWGSKKYLEFVAFSAHPQALQGVLRSVAYQPCRWCGEAIAAPRCPLCLMVQPTSPAEAGPPPPAQTGVQPGMPTGAQPVLKTGAQPQVALSVPHPAPVPDNTRPAAAPSGPQPQVTQAGPANTQPGAAQPVPQPYAAPTGPGPTGAQPVVPPSGPQPQQVVRPAPQTGAQPTVVQPVPHRTGAQPQVVQPGPNQTGAQPQVAQPGPNQTGAQPPVAQPGPSQTEAQPTVAQPFPQPGPGQTGAQPMAASSGPHPQVVQPARPTTPVHTGAQPTVPQANGRPGAPGNRPPQPPAPLPPQGPVAGPMPPPAAPRQRASRSDADAETPAHTGGEPHGGDSTPSDAGLERTRVDAPAGQPPSRPPSADEDDDSDDFRHQTVIFGSPGE